MFLKCNISVENIKVCTMAGYWPQLSDHKVNMQLLR